MKKLAILLMFIPFLVKGQSTQDALTLKAYIGAYTQSDSVSKIVTPRSMYKNSGKVVSSTMAKHDTMTVLSKKGCYGKDDTLMGRPTHWISITYDSAGVTKSGIIPVYLKQ